MANTDLSYYASDVYIGGPFVIEWYQAGDGNCKPGYALMHDDADEIKIAATNAAHVYGHAGLAGSQEIDTAYTSAGAMPVICRHVGTTIWGKHDGTSETVLKGIPMTRSNGTAGACELWAYADTAQATDTLCPIVGWGAQYAVTGGTAIWVKLRT